MWIVSRAIRCVLEVRGAGQALGFVGVSDFSMAFPAETMISCFPSELSRSAIHSEQSAPPSFSQREIPLTIFSEPARIGAKLDRAQPGPLPVCLRELAAATPLGADATTAWRLQRLRAGPFVRPIWAFAPWLHRRRPPPISAAIARHSCVADLAFLTPGC